MSGGNYSMGKRQRDQEKARKKRRKAERRAQKRADGPAEIPIASAEDLTGDLVEAERDFKAKRAAAEADARSVPSRLFVGGLSWDTTADDLRAAFEKLGRVSDAAVVTDRDTGRSRGFGFVTMADRRDAARAIDEMDGSELDGRNIVVNIATERRR
ncbi:MAG: RNA recognition motif domain-containing protein [Planctomycetota bacterium]|jgi:RNA recognition motif-containing protein